MAKLEKNLDRKLKKYGEEKGGLAIKMESGRFGKSGFPDRLWLFPQGVMFFMELKAPDGENTDLQLYRQNQLRKLGFMVVVVNDYTRGKEIIDSVLKRGVRVQ